MTTKLYLATLARQDVPEVERRPFIVCTDEVRNLIHGTQLPTILWEARKYALASTIATQAIRQLSPECVDAVFADCATILTFRVGGDDAETPQAGIRHHTARIQPSRPA